MKPLMTRWKTVPSVLGLLAGLRVGPLALALGELHKVLDRLRRVIRQQPHLDVAVVGLQGGVKLLSHDLPSVVFCDTPILPRTGLGRVAAEWARAAAIRGIVGEELILHRIERIVHCCPTPPIGRSQG
jgi:hypothetical protein